MFDAGKQGESQKDSSIVGFKTFFVGADSSVVPDAFLEDFIAYGIEAYRVQESSTKALVEKIELTAYLFPGSVFFFYVDLPLEGMQWPELVLKFLRSHREHARIGIMYNRRSVEGERIALEHVYDVMKLDCGYLPLGPKRAQNFPLILQQLENCEVRGKRRHIRVQCGASSTVTFFVREAGRRIAATLMDFSLNHFSCIVNGNEEMPPYDGFEDVLVQTSGIRFRTDCRKITERQTSHGKLFVFVFLQKGGTAGLENDTRFKVQEKIYEMVTEPVRQRLQEAATIFLKYRRDDLPIEAVCDRTMQELRQADRQRLA